MIIIVFSELCNCETVWEEGKKGVCRRKRWKKPNSALLAACSEHGPNTNTVWNTDAKSHNREWAT